MLPRNLDLNLLQVFDAVYGAGSVSAAAEVLGVSQPAVSGALARLREVVDDPLFVRQKGGMTPTARADAMAGPVREALTRLSGPGLRTAPFDPSTVEGEFRITMVDIAEPVFAPHLWRVLKSEAPGLRVQFLPIFGTDFLADLYSGRTHAALQYIPPKAPHIRAHPTFRIDLVCVGRRGWTDTYGPMDREAFGRAGFAVMNQSLRTYVPLDRMLASQGVQRRIVCELSGFWSIVAAVAGSDLICVMPKMFADAMTERMGLEQMPFPYDYPTEVGFLLWHERNNTDPLQKWLRSVCIDAFRQSPYAAPLIDEGFAGGARPGSAARGSPA